MINKIGVINKIYRHANRYLEIVNVIASHGFSDIVSNSKLTNYINFGKRIVLRKKVIDVEKYSVYERVRMILEKLGPTFIKFGQVMSNRSDLIPQELILELEKLQDSVPPFPGEEAKQLIEQELKDPIEKLFAKFEITPLAGASISQVHRAVLFDKSEVIVKVQRPNIIKKIKIDLEIMLHIAMMAEKHIPDMKAFNLISIVEEFNKAIKQELDFTIEAAHMERFAADFHKDSNIYVPKCNQELSTKTILTMEFMDGIKVANIKELEKNGLSLKKIAINGVDAILKQIFEHGFFHADPHPGNIFILENNVIAFIDFGMMGILSKKTQESFASIILGVVNKDIQKVTRSLLKLSPNSNDVEISELEISVSELVDKHFYKSLQNLDMVTILNDLLSLFIANNLKMPSNFYLLTRALVLAQAFGTRLDPDFNISEHLKHYTKKMLRERFNPKTIAKEIYSFGNDFWELLLNFPAEIQDIILKVKQGKLKIDIEHKGFESMMITHERISNKIAFSVVLASIVIGSSVLILPGIPPLIYGVSIIGLLGFLGAVILGFWLLISIMKHGKM
jgi:ubiquinone biosynthesis protein